MGFMSVHLKMPSQMDSTVDGLDGWKYLGGVRYRAPYGANNEHTVKEGEKETLP